MDFKLIAETENLDRYSQDLATHLDATTLSFRSDFHIPSISTTNPQIYLCGNSLGLQPKLTRKLINEELDVWADGGVTGHFRHEHGRPWVKIDDIVQESMATIVGAHKSEIAVMNSLTVNIHLLMIPFYRPTQTRFKILMEAKAFPSDYFAFESQVKFHGFDPVDSIIQVKPKHGLTLQTEDILAVIREHGDSIALVLFGGVQYYTGQLFEIAKITKAAHEMVPSVSSRDV